MSTLAGNLPKNKIVVPTEYIEKAPKGSIPVAAAGDLPKDTPVVPMAFLKKHGGKLGLGAAALGIGAYAISRKKHLGKLGIGAAALGTGAYVMSRKKSAVSPSSSDNLAEKRAKLQEELDRLKNVTPKNADEEWLKQMRIKKYQQMLDNTHHTYDDDNRLVKEWSIP